jgi:hypothetical protein
LQPFLNKELFEKKKFFQHCPLACLTMLKQTTDDNRNGCQICFCRIIFLPKTGKPNDGSTGPPAAASAAAKNELKVRREPKVLSPSVILLSRQGQLQQNFFSAVMYSANE